jgi:hypothetical protein
VTETKDLRARTIERILEEDAFCMGTYGDIQTQAEEPHCKTAYCIAGHIVAAASELNIPFMVLYDPPSFTRHQDDFNETAITARQIWAKVYGEQEADRLEFDEKGWGYALDHVSALEAVDHLNGAPPVVHGEPWEDDDC